jgi:hypothetical protein
MHNLWQKLRLWNGNAAAHHVIVVSGLPRSGTSLMMSMLAAGGVPVLTDQHRRADEDNPQGYFEFERVKRLERGDVGWLAAAKGKAVKVISALLPFLPPNYSYRVLFMERPLPEILASQRAMLVRRQTSDLDHNDDGEMTLVLGHHLEETRHWLTTQPNMQTLPVPYHQLVDDAPRLIEGIGHFLHLPLDTARMTTVIEPALYRNRGESVGQ